MMHQPTQNSQLQGQLKRTTPRSKVQETTYTNDRNKKNIPIPGGAGGASRRPVKNYNKQVNGGREKTFSKNEKKITGSQYGQTMAKNTNGNGRFAVQDLLNFQYSSGRQVDSVNPRRYQNSRKKKPCFNKEEYLQAKCQFVVIGSVDDYAINTVDPDKLVDWEQIRLVYLPSHESSNCPICLYSPIVAKMTRCGHIFCWSCILHYLQLSDNAWRKCPICHEAVHESDLKSVKSIVQKKYERLDSITMQLMRRYKDSIFVMPKHESDSAKLEFNSWMGKNSGSGSKILLATPEDVHKHILLQEKDELQAQLNIDMADNNGEDAFISMALLSLEEDIKSFKSTLLPEGYITSVKEEEVKEDESDIYNVDGNGNILSNMLNDININDHYIEAAFSDDDFEIDKNASHDHIEEMSFPMHDAVDQVEDTSYLQNSIISSTTNDTMQPFLHDDNSEVSSSQDGGSVPSSVGSEYNHKPKGYNDSYYFYQAVEGQNIFLHSLNARCLIEEYSALEFGPQNINGQIIDFECFTMTKELRKRFRYLSHLPLSSEFMICELILKPPLLSRNTIHNFTPEFKNRKAMRMKKLKEQQKFDRRATAAENKSHGFRTIEYSDDEDAMGIDLSNTAEFPSNLSPDGNDHHARVMTYEEKEDSQQFHGVSFAQMLNKKSEVIAPQKKDRNSAPVYRSLQGPEPVPFVPKDPRIIKDEEDGPDVVAPDFKQTFSAAMFATPLKSESKNSPQNGGKGNGGGKGKKKKEKGMLLFATGGQRKY